MTPQESRRIETAVARYLRARTPRQADEVARAIEGPITALAHHYAGPRWPLEDLVQEGQIGALTALESFDPNYNCQFLTYAHVFILGQMRAFMRAQAAMVTEPTWLYKSRQRIERAEATIRQEQGRQATDEELMAQTALPAETLERVRQTQALFHVASLTALEGTAAPEGGVPVEAWEDTIDTRLLLSEALARLPARWCAVLEGHYLEGLTLKEISLRLALSYNYVCQLHDKALRRMRKIYPHDSLE